MQEKQEWFPHLMWEHSVRNIMILLIDLDDLSEGMLKYLNNEISSDITRPYKIHLFLKHKYKVDDGDIDKLINIDRVLAKSNVSTIIHFKPFMTLVYSRVFTEDNFKFLYDNSVTFSTEECGYSRKTYEMRKDKFVITLSNPIKK